MPHLKGDGATHIHMPCSCTCMYFCPPTGAQIIDLMMLVVDITKGVQTQTAEVRNALTHVYVASVDSILALGCRKGNFAWARTAVVLKQ